ncbi:MAG TPA: DUF2961 domain-containing protein, partial [Polyangiales bacterium]|nr:DUF2961 domain-containing protein [Polyangiales bacterium]
YVSVHEQRNAPPSEAGHFHVRFVERAEPGDRYQVAELRGPGKYVGTLMFMQGQADPDSIAPPHTLAFLEGDERIVVDDIESVLGTGTEDYFDAGYYWLSGRFDSPFATLVALSEDDEHGSVTAARWHVLTNSIEFRESFDFSFEYGADLPKTAERYASVAYYYLFE